MNNNKALKAYRENCTFKYKHIKKDKLLWGTIYLIMMEEKDQPYLARMSIKNMKVLAHNAACIAVSAKAERLDTLK